MIPQNIIHCKKTTRLTIGYTYITNLSYQIGRLTRLTQLSIDGFIGVKKISPEIGCLTNLETLNINKTISMKTLPIEVFELKKLRTLNLFTARSISELSSKIGQLKNLERLDIRGTKIKTFPLQMKALTNLRFLLVSKDFPQEEIDKIELPASCKITRHSV